jgi:hypothetical protein
MVNALRLIARQQFEVVPLKRIFKCDSAVLGVVIVIRETDIEVAANAKRLSSSAKRSMSATMRGKSVLKFSCRLPNMPITTP